MTFGDVIKDNEIIYVEEGALVSLIAPVKPRLLIKVKGHHILPLERELIRAKDFPDIKLIFESVIFKELHLVLYRSCSLIAHCEVQVESFIEIIEVHVNCFFWGYEHIREKILIVQGNDRR